MPGIFPIIQPQLAAAPQSAEMPLYKEVAWDFENGQPIFKNGAPHYVTGLEAIKTWIWKALVTDRMLYEIYTWDFGNEFATLIGQNFVPETKLAEAARYVHEALEVNPYISDITDISVEFSGDKMTINAVVDTIYGRTNIYVRR